MDAIVIERAVSAADANRKFSEILREVRNGGTVVVTVHGKPAARIVPATVDATTAATPGKSTLLSRLRRQRTVDVGRWKRESLYR